jgi:hypothetical protein
MITAPQHELETGLRVTPQGEELSEQTLLYGRYGARSHPGPANPLAVSLARNLPRHSPNSGLARKREGKVWRKPNSSHHLYVVRF